MKFEHRVTFGGRDIKVNVTLDYHVDGDRVIVDKLETDHLVIAPFSIEALPGMPDTKKAMTQVYTDKNNQNLTTYLDVLALNKKFGMWNGKIYTPQKTFVAVHKTEKVTGSEDPAPLGFFNIGNSGIGKINEGGYLVHSNYNGNPVTVELAIAVLDYFKAISMPNPEKGHDASLLESNMFIYTTLDPNTRAVLASAGMKTDLKSTPAQDIVAASGNRFEVKEELFYEGGKPKTLLYFDGALDVVGEVQAKSDEAPHGDESPAV